MRGTLDEKRARQLHGIVTAFEDSLYDARLRILTFDDYERRKRKTEALARLDFDLDFMEEMVRRLLLEYVPEGMAHWGGSGGGVVVGESGGAG